MRYVDTAELTLQERGMLATTAAATYFDELSRGGRRLVTAEQPTLRTQTKHYSSRGMIWQVSWKDSGQPLPGWFDATMQGIVDALSLPVKWDSYEAKKIERAFASKAFDLLERLLLPSSPAPRVVPLASGGLQLEWHRAGVDIEVIFEPSEPVTFYHRNRSSGEEGDYELPQNLERLRTLVRGLH